MLALWSFCGYFFEQAAENGSFYVGWLFTPNCLSRYYMLNTARHRSINIVNLIHLYHNFRATQKARNSSTTIHIFARSIPKTFISICEHTFNLPRRKRERLLELCKMDGRMTIFRQKHPMLILTPKRIVLTWAPGIFGKRPVSLFLFFHFHFKLFFLMYVSAGQGALIFFCRAILAQNRCNGTEN